ncbi:MAG TPA: NUDIX domain-containing protein [Terriglobales bacterium]|nr:NUDIX domain-containing protein [Terriglobales bacterium]
MKRDYPERPLIGVGAVIVDGGRVVVVRRGHEPLKGEWSIPGGVLEIGETLRAGAVREALEETGLAVEAGEVLEVLDRIVRDGEGRIQFHYVLIDFLCRRTGGELRAGGDAEEARWIRAGELDSFSIADSAAAVLRKGLDRAER